MSTDLFHSVATRKPATWLACMLIRAYQSVVAPLLPPACRFEPSCSHYTLEALRRHGLFKGLWLGARRICRCHPWHPGGYDPVPECGAPAMPRNMTHNK